MSRLDAALEEAAARFPRPDLVIFNAGGRVSRAARPRSFGAQGWRVGASTLQLQLTALVV